MRKGDQQSRDRLSDAITSCKNKILIHKRFKKDKRTVFKDMPQRVKALIVQKKIRTHQSVTNQTVEGNSCLECTLLGERGLPMTNYFDALFERHCVLRFVSRSKNNLIVDNLT